MKKLTLSIAIFATLILASCSKEEVKTVTPPIVNTTFVGTYVGTYNSGAGTANSTYSFVFIDDTNMNVYDGTVATGSKATGKYTKTGNAVTGFYKYTGSNDSIMINGTVSTSTPYVLTGTWTKKAQSGQFTVTKQ